MNLKWTKFTTVKFKLTDQDRTASSIVESQSIYRLSSRAKPVTKIPFICNFILMQIKLIFIRKVLQEDSKWNRGNRQLAFRICQDVSLRADSRENTSVLVVVPLHRTPPRRIPLLFVEWVHPGWAKQWRRKYSLAGSFPSRAFENKRLLHRIRGSGITGLNSEQKCSCERNWSISHQVFLHKFRFFGSNTSNKVPWTCEDVILSVYSRTFQKVPFSN